MFKKFALVITITLAVVLGYGLIGCSDAETADASQIAEDTGLVVVSRTMLEGGGLTIDGVLFTLYDPDTYVMYVFACDYGAGGGCQLMPMIDQDGTPKLYHPHY